MAKYDIAAWVVPSEQGIMKGHLSKIMTLLPHDLGFLPFSIQINNYLVCGFITMDSAYVLGDNWLDKVATTTKEVFDFSKKEHNSQQIYMIEKIRMYLGFDNQIFT